jgi:hypothetical protein
MKMGEPSYPPELICQPGHSPFSSFMALVPTSISVLGLVLMIMIAMTEDMLTQALRNKLKEKDMKPSQNSLFKADTYAGFIAESGILGLVHGYTQKCALQCKHY